MALHYRSNVREASNQTQPACPVLAQSVDIGMSARCLLFEGEADSICSTRVLPSVTRSGISDWNGMARPA
jgi:hypothetical protein